MNAVRAITRSQLAWALGALTLAIAPHATRFSAGMLVCFAALALWRWLGAIGRLPLPERRRPVLWLLKHLLAVGALVAVFLTYQGQLGRDAGVALLAALLGLKLVEMQTPRDYYVVMLLGYFLVVTNFFYSQTLPTAGLMLLDVVVITAGLVHFNAGEAGLGIRTSVRWGGLLVLQSLPLMAIGFVLFPRIPGPLWGIPQDGQGAVTGLSDEMTIGHITELGVSDEIAFRVAFAAAVPTTRDLYWRGPVLWRTDGRTWRAGSISKEEARPAIKHGESYRYTVTLEPHGQPWLFGIDAVTATAAGARLTSDYELLASRPVKRRLRYTLESTPHYVLPGITPAERAAALQLPARKHPRARALARSWRDTGTAAVDVVAAALDYFRREAFSYTLSPAALAGDPIDQFLFTTREGFCEHYAASFVVLMRAAGIPARVVTGYQGGEFNTLSDYMIIRQRDAHAWAEVYLDERGWVRVDPTAAVAPERVSLGINESLPRRTPLAMFDGNSTALALLKSAAQLWDAANYRWSQWVLGYTPQRQQEVLAALGLEDVDYGTLTLLLTVAIALVTALSGWFLLRTRGRAHDPVTRSYRRFCAKLARIGFIRAAHEGPQAFAARVLATRADLYPEVTAIIRLYIALRYADAKIDPQLLVAKVRAFKPRGGVETSR